MPILTRRWNDPPHPDEGFRLLITRYRPRGVPREAETWDAWQPGFGPSKALHAAVYTTTSTPIAWTTYRARYLQEQRLNREAVINLAKRVAAGETITLLCSSACERESRCHRSILKELLEKHVQTR